MTTSLSNDFNLGEILENINNKVDIDFDNVKDKPVTIAKILEVLGFQAGGGWPF